MTTRGWLAIGGLAAVWFVMLARRCEGPGAGGGARVTVARTPPVTAEKVVPEAVPAAPQDAAVAPDAPVAPAAPRVESVHDRVWGARRMISPDGKQLFMPVTDSDTARGAPNLTLQLLDRKGRVIEEQVIQALPEDEPGSEEEVAARVAAREVAAAAWLDRLHAAGFSWEPLEPIQADPPSGQDTDGRHARLVAEGETTPRLTIDLTLEGTLTVRPRGASPIRQHHDGWRGKPTPAEAKRLQREWDAGRQGCFNGGYLAGADVDLRHRIAIVEIAYHGNDSCWEGGPSAVIVAW